MARAAAVAAALLVAAWFAVGVRQADGVSEARERLQAVEAPSPAEARRTAAALDRAGALNPDTAVDVLRARFALQQGRRDDARRLLLRVVDREPENLEAWAAVAIVFEGTDPALAARARDALRRLSPPVPPA